VADEQPHAVARLTAHHDVLPVLGHEGRWLVARVSLDQVLKGDRIVNAHEIRVPPDGPVNAHIAIVGEGPAREEVREGRGFVGPSGSLLWPLLWRLAGISRSECYVTNLSKTPLENGVAGEAKMTPEEFEANKVELMVELDRVRPRKVLAVGALAAKALLGGRFTNMHACNGVGFLTEWGAVYPTWHPAAALYGGHGNDDPLAWTGAAIQAFGRHGFHDIHPAPLLPPPIAERLSLDGPLGIDTALGIDTEGTPEAPICMTLAGTWERVYVTSGDVPKVLASIPPNTLLVFHNALWDWRVLWAMGAPRDMAARWPWVDTMEMAYLAQTEPRGLKDLAWRHLGLRMRSFQDVVMPHYHASAERSAQLLVDGMTTYVTHSAKTGRLLKKPKAIVAPEAKVLKRNLKNPAKLAKLLGMPGPSLDLVPRVEAREYATMDAWATLMVYRALVARRA